MTRFINNGLLICTISSVSTAIKSLFIFGFAVCCFALSEKRCLPIAWLAGPLLRCNRSRWFVLSLAVYNSGKLNEFIRLYRCTFIRLLHTFATFHSEPSQVKYPSSSSIVPIAIRDWKWKRLRVHSAHIAKRL